jgi:hypothetical protein
MRNAVEEVASEARQLTSSPPRFLRGDARWLLAALGARGARFQFGPTEDVTATGGTQRTRTKRLLPGGLLHAFPDVAHGRIVDDCRIEWLGLHGAQDSRARSAGDRNAPTGS